MPDTLYEQDFYRWTQEQASALRRAAQEGANLPVDWENVAEEIEDLGTAHRSELRSRLRTIIEHFLKLCHSPAVAPRAGWRETVQRSRLEIDDVLSASPSLRRELPELAEQARRGALKIAAAGLRAHGEKSAEVLSEVGTAPYTLDQLLGDWFPPEPDRT